MHGLRCFSKKMNLSSVFQLNPFWLELFYFITLSCFGFLALEVTNPRASTPPNGLDLFFTSVSASTVSSMSTVEMEVFSNTQLVFLTFLMFLGGEVFTSLLGLHLMMAKEGQENHPPHPLSITNPVENSFANVNSNIKLKLKSLKFLAWSVLCYIFVAHVAGSALIPIYMSFVPTAKRVVEKKGIKMSIFSFFTTVSALSNCGFVPTNENMVAFKKNPGLLLILIPQLLMGNMLYPICLRAMVSLMEKTTRREEYRYILENSRELGYRHLIPLPDTVFLGTTVLGLIGVQAAVFLGMEWDSEGVCGGMSVYEKAVGIFFQVVNSRHTGQLVFDLSAVSQAVLVMFVLMMYLPPYTSYVPIEPPQNTLRNSRGEKKTRTKTGFWQKLIVSQITYLFIFVFLICVTERHKMKTDPLNFNVLNILFEVVSAYGNVGFTVGYSCERQINRDAHCKDAWYGFVGKWSNGAKVLLIIVMFFGRLKQFNKRGGSAWRLA